MALLNPIPTPYGVNALYHHVAAILWDKVKEVCQVQLASFASEAARRAPNGIPLGRVNFEFPSATPLSIEAAYHAIKENADWSNAEDA